MTNVETVKRILPTIKSRFTLAEATVAVAASGATLTRDQVSKSLRSISYVKALGSGKFHVKGRKVN